MRIALTYNEKRTTDEREAEFDSRATIDMLVARLSRLGHHVVPVEVSGPITWLVDRLARVAPDVVFDIAEGERGAFREAFYPALFEQLGLPCTGSSPSCRALCLDKRLAKRIVAAAGVDVPADDSREGPLIVKPNCEGSSKGITAKSVVRDRARLAGVVQTCADRYVDVLVEEFVEGFDVSTAWVDGLGWLPEMRYHYDAPVYEYALKHVTQERVRVEIPAALDDDIRTKLHVAALRAFTALGVSGYGRADFRIAGDRVVFLELNPLPSLSDGELFAAATAMGSTPDVLLACIIRSAMPARAMRAAASHA